jgi:hypothetical protein
VAFSFLRMTPALASEALGGWGVDLFRCCRMQETRLFWMVFRRFALKNDHLPRQARDHHNETLKTIEDKNGFDRFRCGIQRPGGWESLRSRRLCPVQNSALLPQVGETPIGCFGGTPHAFLWKHDDFVKTCSGQTQGKRTTHRKRVLFTASRATSPSSIRRRRERMAAAQCWRR